MTASRKKLVTSSVLLLGIGALVVAGMTFYSSLRERYWLSRLHADSEEEREEAVKRLGEVGSVRAIPFLLESCADRLNGTTNWEIMTPPDQTHYCLTIVGLRGGFGLPIVKVKMDCHLRSIRTISRNRPELAESVLRPYLADEREVVRAFAALALFGSSNRSLDYISSERGAAGLRSFMMWRERDPSR